MQAVSTAFTRALLHSHTPEDKVEVWRGGQLLIPDLKVLSGKITVSGGNGQVVRSSVSISAVDPTGELVPVDFDSALAPFGSEFRIQMGVKLGTTSELVTMGWYPLISVEIDEVSDFRIRPAEPENPIWFSKGAILDIEAADRMFNIEQDKFTYRQQPSGSTVFAETVKLLDINRPAYGGVTGSVSDKSIPSDLTYDSDRLKALLSLAGVVEADPYIDPSGLFRYRTTSSLGTVWRLEKGEFSVLKATKRKLTREGVYNGALETSTATNDRPLQAGKFVTSGALRWGGAYGRVPLLHSSPLLTTQSSVNAAVNTLFTRATTLTPQQLPIECVRNPALEWGDQIELPTRTGYVPVKVTSISYNFGVDTMQLIVSVNPFELRGLI